MSSDLLLMVQTAQRRYALRRRQFNRLVAYDPAWQAENGRPTVYHQLGPLLDPTDPPINGRSHTLIVELRRRNVGLIIARAEDLTPTERHSITPLVPLLARRLSHQWIEGVLTSADEPILLLDLQRIARDLLQGLA